MGPLISGAGSRLRVGELLPREGTAVALLYTEGVAGWAGEVGAALSREGRSVVPHVVADGELGKRVAEAERAWSRFAGVGLTRSDTVVAVGGGALTDAAGFFAATWLRGLAWVAVPTTTLGMTDAAHGGKVAVNTAAGKNLVGAFHEPLGVVIDPDTLGTLPDRDLRAGMVEAVKCAWLAGVPVGDLLGAGRDAAIRQAAEYKRSLVARDPLERGERILLNYGHTVGHAVEAASGYALRHGEAVGIGMVLAAELAERLRIGERGLADRHRAVLQSMGVPVAWPGDPESLEPYLRLDKKRTRAGLRWVLLEREGVPVVTADVPAATLAQALRALSQGAADQKKAPPRRASTRRVRP